MAECKHESFEAMTNVNRLTDDEGRVESYSADITIKCADCGMYFDFLGLPKGLSPDSPSKGWTVDGVPEARLPIKPKPWERPF
jgi:hypothetical protein